MRYLNKMHSDDVSLASGQAVYRRIERRIHRLELDFGRERLLRTIARVSTNYLSEHVDAYRAIVRTRQWPNEDRPTSFNIFLEEYAQAALAYVDVAFEVLRFLDGARTLTLAETYGRVIASEALRGQFGKRSPTGLDQRLDQGVEEIEEALFELLGDQPIDDQVELLCTPIAPWLSAEAALLEDLAALFLYFPSPPSIRDILSADDVQQEVAWTFLRRHAKWSVESLSHYYAQFDGAHFEHWLLNARRQRVVLAQKHSNFLSKISARIGDDEVNKIANAVTEATILNQLNLALEPSFSFKGSPGIPHGLIFRTAPKAELGAQIALDQLSRKKWELFSSTSNIGD